MDGCRLCPRQCGADRTHSYGLCGVKGLRIARYGRHDWEEPIISGTSGSGTVFFSGCPLKCVYCQNYEVSHCGKGEDVSVKRLAEIFREIEESGMHNINLVTPTHFADSIAEALALFRPHIPVVYNTGGYESVRTLDLMRDCVDIYLTDFKYADSDTARRYSGAPDYPEVAYAALCRMKQNRPNNIIENGLMREGVIVRHLVLPGNVAETKKVLQRVEAAAGKDVVLSLMSQYTPCGNVEGFLELTRKLKPLEYKIACKAAENIGFDTVFIQEPSSADGVYIPPFSGTKLR